MIAGGAVRWAPAYAARVEAAIDALPPGARERVIRVGYVEDVERRALLSGAEILAYPSLAEGFGFPVLEGFAANVPVLTSNTSSLPEVAGDAAVLVDPDGPGGDRRRARASSSMTTDLRNVAARRGYGARGVVHVAALARARPRPCCAVRRSTAARLPGAPASAGRL